MAYPLFILTNICGHFSSPTSLAQMIPQVSLIAGEECLEDLPKK
jgi:hypothetical protein